MFCSQCGTDHSDDSQFCRKCGRSLAVATTGGGAAAAVAPARTKTPVSRAYKVGRSLRTGMPFLPMLLALALVGAWYFMRITFGSQGTSRVVAAVVGRAAVWVGAGVRSRYRAAPSASSGQCAERHTGLPLLEICAAPQGVDYDRDVCHFVAERWNTVHREALTQIGRHFQPTKTYSQRSRPGKPTGLV
jgi:hypothetical protein